MSAATSWRKSANLFGPQDNICISFISFAANFLIVNFIGISWIEDYIQPAIEQNKVENFKETLEKTRRLIEKNQKKSKSSKSSKIDPDETETEDSDSDHDLDAKKSKGSGPTPKPNKKVARKAKSTKTKTKPKDDTSDLIAAIRNKNGRGNPLASIAARYGVSAMEDDPLNDADFAKLQSKYKKKKK